MAEYPYREDTLVYPVMNRLKDCLCVELETSGLPAICDCDLVPGLADGFIDVNCGDDCDGTGSAWVRLVQVFQSSRLPEADLTGGITFLAVELEVGVARCISAIEPDGTAPDAVTKHMDTRDLLADMAAARRAIKCCFGGTRSDDEVDYVIGPYTPMPGIGGVGGGVWQVFARVS